LSTLAINYILLEMLKLSKYIFLLEENFFVKANKESFEIFWSFVVQNGMFKI